MKRKMTMLVLIATLAAAPAWGQAEDGRTLGGYRFIPSTSVQDPFINTQFRSFTGMAWANDIKIHSIYIDTDPPTEIFSVRGDFLFVVAEFKYQLKVHPRIALAVGGGGASRVGTTGTALLSQGVTAATDINLTGLVKIWDNDKVMLSGALYYEYYSGLLLDFVGFAEDIAEGDYLGASLVNELIGSSYDAGLRAAWAVGSWGGVTAVGQLGGTTIDTYEDELRWRVAAGGSVDFGQRGNAPVGLSLEFEYDELGAQLVNGEYSAGIGVGVFYTGREDLNLGVELGGSYIPIRDSDIIVRPMGFGMSIHYFF